VIVFISFQKPARRKAATNKVSSSEPHRAQAAPNSRRKARCSFLFRVGVIGTITVLLVEGAGWLGVAVRGAYTIREAMVA
jgi:hypothetical protein